MSERERKVRAIAQTRKLLERMESELATFDDPTHEHDWIEYDGSRHCFRCRRTERLAGSPGPGGTAP